MKPKRSWQTSSAGIGAILIALGGLATEYGVHGTISMNSYIAASGALITGIGLMFARDNNKSSEDVGIK